jgi:hypothetical protein
VTADVKEFEGDGGNREQSTRFTADYGNFGLPSAFLSSAALSAHSRVSALVAVLFAAALISGPPLRTIDA